MESLSFAGSPEPAALVRPAADAKAELAAACRLFEESGRKRLEAAVAIGGILSERKKLVGHGNWLKWLEAHFPFGRTRASQFILVWKNRAKCSRACTFEDALNILSDTPESEEPTTPEEVAPPEAPASPPPAPPASTVQTTTPNVQGREHLKPVNRPDSPPEPATESPAQEPSEESAEEPDEHGRAPRSTPAWFKPGSHVDPDHPFADLLAKMTALSAAFTRAMADPDHGDKLRDYLLVVQRAKVPCPLFVLNRMLVVEGKNYGAQFVWLRAIRRIVRLAGAVEKKKPTTLVKEFTEAQEDDS